MQLDKILVLLVVATVLGCEQSNTETSEHSCSKSQKVAATQTKLITNGGLVLYKDQPFCGTTETYYADHRLAESIDYCQGKRNGKQQKWFPNGQKAYEGNYALGKLNGPKISWWSNGTMRSEATLKHGTLAGTVKEWYKSGKNFKELNYKNGKEHGMQRAWRENGKLYINYEAKDGRIFGLKRSNLCYSLEDEEVQYTRN